MHAHNSATNVDCRLDGVLQSFVFKSSPSLKISYLITHMDESIIVALNTDQPYIFFLLIGCKILTTF